MLALLVGLALCAALYARRAAEEERAWAEAREILAASDANAVSHFEALLASGRSSARARVGLRVARALTGAADDAPVDARGLAALDVSLPGLLEDALRAGRLEACGALARLLSSAGDPVGGVYLAAVEVELGDHDAARARVARRAKLFADTALGRAVVETLEWRARGVTLLLRDRRGRLLGALNAATGSGRIHPGRAARDGRFFEPRDELAAACVPAGVLEALARLGPVAGTRLTLDLDLCALALQARGEQRGSIVLLDAATGALLAAVSDERTRRREPSAALTQLREPASTAKLITTTAALRAGVDPDEFLRRRRCHGSQHDGAGTLWCPAPARVFGGLARPLAISCNVAFADLAQEVGRTALLEEYRRYGFTLAPRDAATPAPRGDARVLEGGAEADDAHALPQDLDGDATVDGARDAEQGARVLAPQGDARQLADLSIGLQDVAVTPLYGARFAAVFAHGTLPRVRLIEALDGALGRTPRPLRVEPPQAVLDPAWLPRLWPAMQAVALWGTAAGVAPASFPVAMKTGTASQFRVGYHCQHFGVGPLPHPTLAFAVRVTHQRSSPRAGAAAREVSARLLAGLAESGIIARARRAQAKPTTGSYGGLGGAAGAPSRWRPTLLGTTLRFPAD